MKPLILLFVSTPLLAALPAVGPDYHRPTVAAPDGFHDLPAESAAWKAVAPAGMLPRGEWWRLFGDPVLDDLVARALAANQDLQAAAARVAQARAEAGLARSAYLPSMELGAGLDRGRASSTTDGATRAAVTETHFGTLNASWEIDLFGRVRRLSESARALAAASTDDFANVQLVLTAEVASGYFSLRALDRELAIVADGVALRREALALVTSRRSGGISTDFDVARAETELASTEAEAAALALRRAALQNTLAVLTGESAPAFALAPDSAQPLGALPEIPVGLPSELLERRPDIAAAEAALVAANARIGVAKAAFFPAIALTGAAGYASADIDQLFNSDSRTWAIGPRLYLPVFQGGRNRANLERSHAIYEENVASFRQRVLVAFREVQDALSATRFLAEQAAAQERALAAARRAGALAQTRYDGGLVSYFEVIDAQRAVLLAERSAAQLSAQRLITHVALIKALGGGWNAPVQVADAR
ncbi:MAG TPA: efflux transporter outer membrane subunit [Opitutaceae bacterium]